MDKKHVFSKRATILASATGADPESINVEQQRSLLQKRHTKSFVELQKNVHLEKEYQDKCYELRVESRRAEAQRRVYGKAEEARQLRKIKKGE
jgi:hypothetical protein